MSDYKAILEEEFEVLESIFPDELESGSRPMYLLEPTQDGAYVPLLGIAELSETSVSIRIEPEEQSISDPSA
uniref:RWD domain-containing protein n=1 Tax=Kwoniella bestiolae CBS 10118 TaxID=1296100 RepID=A0A1B9FYT6_9TREE|nr:hypothetical protein I302_06918 [Kwoniella bestiolae CBS 10118]OCF23932.1 hypothetical protein I302_06918 [Kwoniella bestiolae CBS 10118]